MVLSVDDTGSGLPVVLLHAFPLSRAMWRGQQQALADVCRLIAPDLPGFGDSPLGDRPHTIEAMADAVAETLDALSVRQPVVLGGLSMGGYVTLAFARKYPERLAGLILADTRSEADDETARANRERMIALAATSPASAIVESMLPKLLGTTTHASRPQVVEQTRQIGSAQKPATLIAALEALRDRPDVTSTLGQIRVPTLVLVGDEDALTPPNLAEKLAQNIPHARRVVLQQAGHLSALEQPADFSAALHEFIATIPR